MSDLRLVHHLVNVHVGRARDARDLAPPAAARSRNWPSALRPTTCTSMGAGRPKFRIWLVMLAASKKNATSGNFSCRRLRRRSMYSAVGPCSSASSEIRMSPSPAPDRGAVAEGQVEAAVGKADVVDDGVDLARRNHLPDLVFDRGEDDSRSPRCACPRARARAAASGRNPPWGRNRGRSSGPGTASRRRKPRSRPAPAPRWSRHQSQQRRVGRRACARSGG